MCVAAAIAGAAVVGAAGSAVAAHQGAQAQKGAANTAANTQMSMYNQTAGNLAPYNQTGQQANAALANLYGLPGGKGPNGAQLQQQLSSLPGYQFQMNQGVQAVDRSSAAKGLLNSGATGKALTQYGQGLAGNYLGQYQQGLQYLSNQGQNSAAMTGQLGANAANGVAANQIYAGNAAAGGYVGAANGINNALGQGVGLYGLYQGGYFGGAGGGASQVSNFMSQNPNIAADTTSYIGPYG